MLIFTSISYLRGKYSRKSGEGRESVSTVVQADSTGVMVFVHSFSTAALGRLKSRLACLPLRYLAFNASKVSERGLSITVV